MNKYLKGCSVMLGIIILIILLLIAFFLWSMDTKRKNATNDGIEFTKKCDSIPYISEQPEIQFANFKKNEINTLNFQILRNRKFIKDTVIKKGLNDKLFYKSMNIPYKYFLKTDTIVITTTNKLQYYISGYHHYAYLHYGMFGYVGSNDCRFSENCIINNQESNGIIFRKNGWINPEKSKFIRIINPSSDEYNAFSKKSPIKSKEADSIFKIKRQNKILYSMFLYGIEIGPYKSYYIFGEEIETKKKQIDIIKINTKTGEYKRYKNYPFEN